MVSGGVLSGLAGGLGLFLLGMWLMTEGLKSGAGSALRTLLSRWTVTRLRSFVSGFTITAIVQSSSAVTVSVIGFINAGLLDLSRSLWIVFGSNVGTTMTAWIVAIVGFKFKIEVFALPAIGIGTFFHLFSNRVRHKSFGGALAGLGLLFLGLQILKDAFAGVEQLIDFSVLMKPGIEGIAILFLIGLLLTAIMQSSSASMAIVLTAVSTGIIPLDAGAAAVIGANVGTTVTALVAVLKATANARRVAVAHVLFNVLTALVAFALLGVFLKLVQWIQQFLEMEPNAAVSLALFHTVFNVVGVMLMVPIEPRMTARLERWFKRSEVQTFKPQFLDKNIIGIPDLALNATKLDQKRLLVELAKMIKDKQGNKTLQQERVNQLQELVSGINDFIVQCSQQPLPADTAKSFRIAIQTNNEIVNCLASVDSVNALEEMLLSIPRNVQAKLHDILQRTYSLITECEVELDSAAPEPGNIDRLESYESYYHDVRDYIIGKGSGQEISVRTMEQVLPELHELRRVVRHFIKACKYFAESPLQPPDRHSQDAGPPKDS